MFFWCSPVFIFGEDNGTPFQYSCLENPMDRGPWWVVVHGVAKSQTRLSDFTFTFHFYALEKEMATQSSVLAWRIPGTGEPGGLPSMGSHKVGHDWSNLAAVVASVFILYWPYSSVSIILGPSMQKFSFSQCLSLFYGGESLSVGLSWTHSLSPMPILYAQALICPKKYYL